MDIMFIIGWAIAVFMMFFGITFVVGSGFVIGNLTNFFDAPSLAVTVGGSIAVLMISYTPKYFLDMPKHLKICLMPEKNDPLALIQTISEFAKEARIKGLLSLDSKLQETDNEYLRHSMQFIVDAVDAEKVHQILDSELGALEDRHNAVITFYQKGGAFAPAFGMIGTLMGLVNMLKQMDDPSSIGPAMAIALLTTFYGCIEANVLFNPIANKLKLRHDEEMLCKSIICEGVYAIQAGENPRFIEEKLLLMLEKAQTSKFGSGGESKE